MMKRLFATLIILLFLVLGAQTATAAKPDNPGNSGASTAGEPEASEDPADDAAFDVFKIQSSKKGLIKVDKENFCAGDTFSIAVVFPKSLRAVWAGDADVHLVIRLPNGDLFPFPLFLDGDFPDKPMTLFTLPLEPETPSLPPTLPTGTYQFALVLTNRNESQSPGDSEPEGEGGDGDSSMSSYVPLSPLDVDNWYQGFAGLVGAKSVKIRDVCDESSEESTASDNDFE